MFGLILILLAPFSSCLSSSSVCYNYICKEQTNNKTGCIVQDGANYYLEACRSDWYCAGINEPTNFGKCLLKDSTISGKKKMDEFCYQSTDCITDYCVDNYCTTKAEGKNCTQSIECGIQMKCYQSKCTKWLTNNQNCVDTPQLCKPGSECASNDNSGYVCIPYGSVKSGQIVFASPVSTLKETLCYSLSYDYGNQKCQVDSNRLKSGFPRECKSADDCVSALNEEVSTQCSCKYINTLGKKYCEAFPFEQGNYIEKVREIGGKSFEGCYYWQNLNQEEGPCTTYIANTTNWTPQVKNNLWGSCFHSINLTEFESLIPVASDGSCPIFTCATTNLEDGHCVEYITSENKFYIQSCPSGYYCLTKEDLSLIDATSGSGTNITCKWSTQRTSLANVGDSCWIADDCYTGLCGSNKRCIVKYSGEKCSNDNECNKGYKCVYRSTSAILKTCEKYILIGESCSSSTSILCRPYSACISTSENNLTGTCQPYYSQTSSFYIINLSALRSYTITETQYQIYCKYGRYDFSTAQCVSSPVKTKDGWPLSCSKDSDCDSQYTQDGTCQCGLSSSGNQYCLGFEEDWHPEYYDELNQYYAGDLQNCFNYQINTKQGTFGGCSLPIYLNKDQRWIAKENKEYCYDQVIYQKFAGKIAINFAFIFLMFF